MNIKHQRIRLFAAGFFCLAGINTASAQIPSTHWAKDGYQYYRAQGSSIVLLDARDAAKKTEIVSQAALTPTGQKALAVRRFYFSEDGQKVLIYTNSKKVWRYNTRGDYWLYDLTAKKLTKLGAKFPASSMMFAKFSPDASKVAYVVNHNIYVESLADNNVTQLTTDGTTKLINGTFDWAYEEELFCRDGFRWSPDSKQVAYWQIDASKTKNYLMINTTDSIYPYVVPVEYPVAGEPPSPFKIGVVPVTGGATKWMDIPTDPVLQSYVPRMEWAANSNELIIQHLNRAQNQSELMMCNVATGKAKTIYKENDAAWIDVLASWDDDYSYGGWDWFKKGAEFLWPSEKDGWRHLYRISRDGKKEKLITKGNYDVMGINAIDEQSGYVYFMASPTNATQAYLYRTKLDGSGQAERLSPANQVGSHDYDVSPNGKAATHTFSNYYTQYVNETVSLPDHKTFNGDEKVNKAIAAADKSKNNAEYFKVKTADGVEMDGWMVKPNNFDSKKKYPIVFYVYSEPWGQTAKDQYGATFNNLYNGDMAEDGYIYVSMDNRGTPVPKGRAWRKAIYQGIGTLNIRDQAMAAKEVLKNSFVDTSRVAVWGWSGGGSTTLNLMFQYPDIYKTGIAVAAVGNQLTYDNIYQERYTGVPVNEAGKEAFRKGSPITYAKNLKGNLLYIHGTADDNVHYSNAEQLINELVKYNRRFQLMSYPNRTHSISEGEGTAAHLHQLYTNYLRANCAPGAR
ncbi:S9 family peptidase [Mucilaginibacter pallidiroseus]|uniref:S9 family peptidase n=1 Tax=Mucilaginibacter pallidiroseus TaxID=2599295 RepID=A0A563UFA2_9SPHI|nr:S9 family peptidase [Mucilaginibacter pallidiroseus]TWR29953.1 S9 family peptidase [Mucilaginibacter pallidiroseus]